MINSSRKQSALEIGFDEKRKIPTRARPAVTGATDAFLAHEQSPAKADVPCYIDLTEPNDLTAGSYRFGANPECRCAAGGFEHDVGATAT